jgi:hypothetical protein
MLRRQIIPIALGLAAALAVFAQTHGYGLFGFDSYPILLTSRVQNVHDFIGTFTEALMDGRFEGHFYRPLLNVSFALDSAIWKLNPAGYQLTNAILFGASVAATWILARRLLGASAMLGPWVAVLVFALHPTHVEVFPVPSRRPEMLAWIFGALALALQLRSPSRRWLPAVFSFVAMLSKETALLVPAWIFVALLLTRRNVRKSLTATMPHAVAFGIAVILRLAVLHGLGGYGNTTSKALMERGPDMIGSALGVLLMPQPPLRAKLAGMSVVVACVMATLVAFWWLSRATAPKRPRHDEETNTLLIGAVWLVIVAWTASLAGRMASWYVFLIVGGWSLVMGALAETAWRAARTRVTTTHLGGAGLLGLIAVLTVWPAVYSPFVHRYREWDASAVQSRVFLTELNHRIEAAPNGSTVPSPPIPRWAKVSPAAVAVRGAALFSGMTLDAYFELEYPERHVRLARKGDERPGADEVLVFPTAFVPGFDGP